MYQVDNELINKQKISEKMKQIIIKNLGTSDPLNTIEQAIRRHS